MTLAMHCPGGRVAFAVAGFPIAQGSKTARKCGDRIVMIEAADMATKTLPGNRLRSWRRRVSRIAGAAMAGQSLQLFTRPVELACEFVLPRPKSHYTTTGAVRKNARNYPGKPDLSKLVRAVEDALTGVVWVDDAQVVAYVPPLSKRYALPHHKGGALIQVREL